jgi:hypothetical protein
MLQHVCLSAGNNSRIVRLGKLLLVLASTVILGPEPRWSHDSIVTDFLKALLGNSPVNTVQRQTI